MAGYKQISCFHNYSLSVYCLVIKTSQWSLSVVSTVKRYTVLKFLVKMRNISNSAPWYPNFWDKHFCAPECVYTKYPVKPSHLDNISFSPFFGPDLPWCYLTEYIKGSGYKIRSMVHMSGYVAVKMDCEQLVVELRNKIGKLDTYFWLKHESCPQPCHSNKIIVSVCGKTTVPRHNNEPLITFHKKSREWEPSLWYFLFKDTIKTSQLKTPPSTRNEVWKQQN